MKKTAYHIVMTSIELFKWEREREIFFQKTHMPRVLQLVP